MAQLDPVAIAIVSILASPVAGLIGVLVGSWLSGRHNTAARRLAFIERQINCFYSPMVGLRKEIRALSEFRQKYAAAAHAAYDEHYARAEGNPEALQRLIEGKSEELSKYIEYDNEMLRSSLLPKYRQLQDIFRDNYAYAEPSTRENFVALIEYNDNWKRFMEKTIPFEVGIKFDRPEEDLFPFYDNIEATLDELRAKLASGRP